MKILAIETSCDETAITLLECSGGLPNPQFKILGNALISQAKIHEPYGGVFPMLAKREHQKNLPILLEKVLREGSEQSERGKPQVSQTDKIDAIAVTVGPGLEPALWVGILFAEELGLRWKVPVVPVNHMEGHIYSVMYHDEFSINNFQFPKLEFPALALLVSGGHTELVNIKNFGEHEIVGRTRDDAVGEAFDKVARILGLPYPGGPEISALAEKHRDRGLVPSFEFPRPMIGSKDLNFSFSGLKTAVLYKLKDVKLDENIKEETAHAFEDSAVDVLVEKTKRAIEKFCPKTLIVAGGVSLNTHLRREIKKLSTEYSDLIIRIPKPDLSTDNAVMIGIAGYIKIKNGYKPTREKITARGNLIL